VDLKPFGRFFLDSMPDPLKTSELVKLAEKIKDKDLQGKVIDLLNEPSLKIDSPALPFDEAPGGSYQHHSYRGGLLQHTLAVVRVSMTMCDLVEEVYGGNLDRDIVLAGALIHDVYKIYTYEARGEGFAGSGFGDRLDHLSLLVAELYSRGFPLEVIHVAAAHHGENGPIQPKSVEALIVHLADLNDSEFSRRTLRAAEYILKQSGIAWPRLGSSKEALDLIRAKSVGGWDEVRKASGKR
jgi:7,8-dihydroneopterin 2',3'-cyclic phosphate phosphodiesterase